jgi:putative transposase
MDGRGRFSDNIFVERLWRSLKYEEVYLKAYQSVAEARYNIAAYFDFYNQERLHQALGYRAPRQVFEEIHAGCQASAREKNRLGQPC